MRATGVSLEQPVRVAHPGPITRGDGAWTRRVLIAVALGLVGLLVGVPLVAVFVEGLKKGIATYAAALVEPDALAAVVLTMGAAVARSGLAERLAHRLLAHGRGAIRGFLGNLNSGRGSQMRWAIATSKGA